MVLINQCFAQPLSETLPPVDVGTNAETHSQAIYTVRDLGTLIPERDVSIKSLSSELREVCRRGSEKNVRVRGHGRYQ